MNALVLLSLLRQRGRFKRWLRMVKQPKYVIGMLVMASYWGWLFLSRSFSVGRHGAHGTDVPDWGMAALRLGVAAGLAAVLSLGFLMRTRQPLVFDESEIHYLFTAPLSRKTLIRHALLKVQPPLLVSSAFSALLLGRGTFIDRAERWPSIWLMFTLMFLWSNALGLWKARIDELPRPQAWRRRFATWGGLLAAWLLIAAFSWKAWNDVAAASSGSLSAGLDDMRRMATVLQHEWPLRVVLAPIELPLHALLAANLGERVLGWASALVLAVLLTEWCARSPVRFEDGAIERARQVSEIRAHGLGATGIKRASAKARARRPFLLGPSGPPEIAIIWKNLLLLARTSMARACGAAALALVIALSLIAVLKAPPPLTFSVIFMSMAFAALAPVAAGSFWRNDLRVDLLHVDQLRTWPLSGTRLVAAEIATPAIATTLASLWCLALGLGAATIAMRVGVAGEQALADVALAFNASAVGLAVSVFIGAIPVIAALSFLSTAIQNAVVLIVPGWSRLGRMRQQGAAVAGQQLVLGVARMIALIVGLIPGAALVAGIVLLQGALGFKWSSWELPPLGIVLTVPLVLESMLLVHFCGRLWNRLDPSRELLEGQQG